MTEENKKKLEEIYDIKDDAELDITEQKEWNGEVEDEEDIMLWYS